MTGIRVVVALLFAASIAGCSSSKGPPTRSTSVTAPGPRTISVALGQSPLRATLTLPAANGRQRFPAVVLVGGSGPGDQDETTGVDKPFLDLATGLAARGIATIRYDKRTRDYPHSVDSTTFTPTQEYVPDAVTAVHLLQGRIEIDPRRVFVLGHSQGGTLTPRIAETDPAVAGIILAAAAAAPSGPTLVRQYTYLSRLPGAAGANARAGLPEAEQAEREIDNPDLASEPPTTQMSPILGGVGPAYYLDQRAYDEVATARRIPQPILILQGDRDYQVTVADDLSRWLRGLAGRAHVTVHRYPGADHGFIDGTGPSTPADYAQPSHVDPAVVADIASWVNATHR